jgi:hypothetical protein
VPNGESARLIKEFGASTWLTPVELRLDSAQNMREYRRPNLSLPSIQRALLRAGGGGSAEQ